MSKLTNVFWTGGWDSTYMLIKLLEDKKTVQPIYIIDEGRSSYIKELASMEKIYTELKKLNFCGGDLLPTIKIKVKDVPENRNVTEAYNNIKMEANLGSQYEWLARFAIDNPGVCIGVEKPNGKYGGCTGTIKKFGHLKQVNDTWVLDKNNSTNDCIQVFGNLSFPIMGVTEPETVEYIKKKDYTNIMKNIWFCHSPIKGEACGICRPCEQKMERNMDFLLPNSAIKRYKRISKIEKYFGEKIKSFIKRIIYKIYSTKK